MDANKRPARLFANVVVGVVLVVLTVVIVGAILAGCGDEATDETTTTTIDPMVVGEVIRIHRQASPVVEVRADNGLYVVEIIGDPAAYDYSRSAGSLRAYLRRGMEVRFPRDSAGSASCAGSDPVFCRVWPEEFEVLSH